MIYTDRRFDFFLKKQEKFCVGHKFLKFLAIIIRKDKNVKQPGVRRNKGFAIFFSHLFFKAIKNLKTIKFVEFCYEMIPSFQKEKLNIFKV